MHMYKYGYITDEEFAWDAFFGQTIIGPTVLSGYAFRSSGHTQRNVSKAWKLGHVGTIAKTERRRPRSQRKNMKVVDMCDLFDMRHCLELKLTAS